MYKSSETIRNEIMKHRTEYQTTFKTQACVGACFTAQSSAAWFLQATFNKPHFSRIL
jgi:glutamate racemase